MSKVTMNKISKVLSVGETIYVSNGGKVIPSKCTQITKDGIETEHDFYGYDKHLKLWWLTYNMGCKNVLST